MTKNLLLCALAVSMLGAFAAPTLFLYEESEVDLVVSPASKARLKLVARDLPRAASGVGRRVPELSFRDAAGERHALGDHLPEERVTVIAIRDVGCPVSKRYGHELARLEADYAPRGVTFLYVNESAHNSAEEMRTEIEEYGFKGTYLHDPEMKLAELLGVRTTAEVFVLDAARTLVYRGALDDQYGRGVVRPAATERFLSQALEALLAGERISPAATFAPGCFLGVEGQGLLVSEVPLTYHDQVARIVQANCLDCHRQGGAAPFPLETYEQLKGRAGMVRYMVSEKLMPPWFASDHAEGGGGPFENDLRLEDVEREALLGWIEEGMPLGDPSHAPRPFRRHETSTWAIGEPDLVFELPEAFEVPAEGLVEYTPFIAERIVPEDLWISKLQVLPGDPEVVHHATVTYQPPTGPTAGAFREDLLGRLVPWSRGYDGWRFLYGYLPGKGPRVYGANTARFLPKGSRIRFEMHYTPKGLATKDRTRLGLVLAEREPEWVAQTRMLRNFEVAIAPGDPDARFEYRYTLPCDAELRSFTPHMHLRGRSFLAVLHPREGPPRTLIEIPEWDPDWQFSYVLREPLDVRKGDVIVMYGTFDNSADNPNNPDPKAWVHDGQQIWDEMFMMALEWIRPRRAWRAGAGGEVRL